VNILRYFREELEWGGRRGKNDMKRRGAVLEDLKDYSSFIRRLTGHSGRKRRGMHLQTEKKSIPGAIAQH